jgi:preprotein translocase subunit SecG
MSTQNILLIAQSISLTLAIILILMQNRGAGLSSSFGGSDEVYLTRRGVEKSVVNLTVVCIVVFVVLRIFSLYV